MSGATAIVPPKAQCRILCLTSLGDHPSSVRGRPLGHPENQSGQPAPQQFRSQALDGEYIGLEQVGDGIWNILYYNTLLGRFDEPNKPITGAPALREKC